jgi:hypothetical protein
LTIRRWVCTVADDHSLALATTNAKCGDAAMKICSVHLVQQRDQNSTPTGSDWVPECDRASVRVHAFRLDVELADDRKRLSRERLVELEHVDL